MKKIIYVLAVVLFVVSSCKEKKIIDKNKNLNQVQNEIKEHNHGDHEHGSKSEVKITDIKQNKTRNIATTPILNAYFQIKNALVKSDKAKAAQKAKLLLTAFNKLDTAKLNESKRKEYKEIVENAMEQAEHIIKSPIEHQREHFEVLSEDITDLITLLGTEKTIYLDFCPMANNNKGAYWLSEIKEIKNPYFGEKMPTCGSIKKQIN